MSAATTIDGFAGEDGSVRRDAGPRAVRGRVAGVPATSAFRSLRHANYRIWAGGALISNLGTWMQRATQDWVVLTQLSHHNATAVGIVTAFQFGPQILLLPWGGCIADRYDRRKLLIATQTMMLLLSLSLGVLLLSGLVRLWHVYAASLLLGCVTAIDIPTRQTFVPELVDEADIANATGLNSASSNAARLIGPAAAGLLISVVSAGWVFVIDALSFVAMLSALCHLSGGKLRVISKAARKEASLAGALRYIRTRPELKAIMLMVFVVGSFGLNFPIFITTMSVTTFHASSEQYGLLMSMMAVGGGIGAVLAARCTKPDIALLLAASACFGLGSAFAAVTPGYVLFGLALAIIGACTQLFIVSASALVQLSTEPAMRGRVVAVLLATALCGAPVAGPIVGLVANEFGPRCALGLSGAAGMGAALLAGLYLATTPGVRGLSLLGISDRARQFS